MEEEFNNFMQKVNHISGIISNLASNDENLQKIGDLEAQKYLNENEKTDEIEVENLKLKVKSNKTLINFNALKIEDNPATMSQETFMREVEKDANKRYKDKQRRRERMETLKKQANMAFGRGEYEKALTLYDKAIENIKDCSFLYLNRALTFIQLKLYNRAIEDIKMSLRLNENSLKSWLLLGKIHFLTGNQTEFKHCIDEAKDRNKDKCDFIDGINILSILLIGNTLSIFQNIFRPYKALKYAN